MVVCSSVIVSLYFVSSALYEAAGLEADGKGVQVHLPIQPSSQPSGANQWPPRQSSPVREQRQDVTALRYLC